MRKLTPKFLGSKIAVIVAHPDDESFLASGTILKNNQVGGQSFIICATAGERGKSHLKKKITAQELKIIRCKELEKVAKFLKTKLVLLNFPDAKLKRNKSALFNKILPIVKKISPDFIISFGKDGISGHLDHITIGEVSKRIAQKLKIPFVASAAPPSLSKSKSELIKRREHGRYVKTLNHQVHNTKVKVNPNLKLKVLKFHQSQLDQNNPFSNIPLKATREILSAEYFIQ